LFSRRKIWLESVLRLVEVEGARANEQLTRGCGLIEQLGRSTAKADSQGVDRLDADVAFATLNAADVISMESGSVRQLLLAEAERNAPRPDGAAKTQQFSVNFHTTALAAAARSSLHTISVIGARGVMADFVDISEMGSELQLMIGTGSHLDPAELDPLIMLASLRVMQNAAREALNDDALTILSLLLLVWVRQLRDNPDNGGLVKTTAEDLADLSGWLVERVLASLQALAPHILIDDLALFAEGIWRLAWRLCSIMTALTAAICCSGIGRLTT